MDNANHVLNFSKLSFQEDMISLPFTKNVNIASYVTNFDTIVQEVLMEVDV